MSYLPLTPLFFLLLVGAFVVLVFVIELRLLRYAYMRLGLSPRAAFLLLLGSLVGSYFNIPIAQLPGPHAQAGRTMAYYAMPVVADWPGTVIAVNVGGALIPGVMSLYLLI